MIKLKFELASLIFDSMQQLKTKFLLMKLPI